MNIQYPRVRRDAAVRDCSDDRDSREMRDDFTTKSTKNTKFGRMNDPFVLFVVKNLKL